jgi:hypothetical protein
MGGKLTLRSPLGEGTSLVIELPLEPAGELKRLRLRASSPVPLAGDIHQGGS